MKNQIIPRTYGIDMPTLQGVLGHGAQGSPLVGIQEGLLRDIALSDAPQRSPFPFGLGLKNIGVNALFKGNPFLVTGTDTYFNDYLS